MKVPVFIQQNGDGWTAYALIPTPTPLHDAFGYIVHWPAQCRTGTNTERSKEKSQNSHNRTPRRNFR